MSLPSHLQPLLSPQAYPHAVNGIRLVETHIARILLTGTMAYKIKRPVHFPFVDQRSAEQRAFFCDEEVRLNRRFAPEIYLGVSRVTEAPGGARIDGAGPVIESCVRMRQFDVQAGLDRLLERGALTCGELAAFGRELARIHSRLPCVDAEHDWGRPENVRATLLRNFDECVLALLEVEPVVDALTLRAQLDNVTATAARWMANRRMQGRVRECHGDLHCSNIVRLDGELRAFDCLEFDPALRWMDVADEIAFLLADLAPYEDPKWQQAFLGGYLLESGDYEACRFLRLYQAHRFLVRAKVIALSMEGRSTRDYVAAARRMLTRQRPLLILMSGASGSGKSWVAQQLAPRLSAVHIRSDVERKRLHGLSADTRAGARPGEGLYSPQTSERLQRVLLADTEAVLDGGYTVIVDATFIRRCDRGAFIELAARVGAPVHIIRCEAPRSVLRARIEARNEQARDPSDADLAVLQWQLEHEEPLDSDEALLSLTVSSEDAHGIAELQRKLESQLPVERLTPFNSNST